MSESGLGNRACLAVIPARSGSKRVPRKNIRLMRDKPIIAYTIEAALESGVFSRVVVSTDTEDIASISIKYGAEVPFIRDSSLADDQIHAPLVTLDALDRLDPKGSLYPYVAQLLPNCPLRNSQDIRDSFSQFIQTGTDSQISVTRYEWLNPWWAMERDNNFKLHPLFKQRLLERSQDIPELFCPTGVISLAKAEVLRKTKTFHTGNNTGWEIPWQRAVDIDTEEDWQFAELLLRMEDRRQI